MTTESEHILAAMTCDEKLIDLHGNLQHPVLCLIRALTAGPIEKLLAVQKINDIYTNLLNSPDTSAPFNTILRLTEVTYSTGSKDLDRLPRQGPLVVVANHPFGGLEGIIIGDLIQRVRSDAKIHANYLLRRIAPIKASHFNLYVGGSIPSQRMQTIQNNQKLISWLRFNTYFLANRMKANNGPVPLVKKRFCAEKSRQALIASLPKDRLAAEVGALPENHRLVTHKQLSVFVAESKRIPHLLREIGRLREKTFREEGEGSGHSMDVDLFDSYYSHLFLWNSETCEVVGAYRMGDTRTILTQFGRKGLYTHSLFRFKTGMFRHLANSIELGRAFTRSEYQRQPNCLALLWKGIGAYVVRRPEVHILFGPVSISNNYHRVSKHIIIKFLKDSCTSRELTGYVKARRPYRQWLRRPLPGMENPAALGSIDDVS